MNGGAIDISSRIKIRYQIRGNGPSTFLICNAPGMTQRFWAPLVDILQARHRIIYCDYRGFDTAAPVRLSERDLVFDEVVKDTIAVLQRTRRGQEKVHLLSWCLGAKVAFRIGLENPGSTNSIIAVSVSLSGYGAGSYGAFSNSILKLKDYVQNNPESLDRILRLMTRIGSVPDAAFFSDMLGVAENSSLAHLSDVLAGESSWSPLALQSLGAATRLRNYLDLFQSFRDADLRHHLGKIDIPVLIISGSEDRITALGDRSRAMLSLIPDLGFHDIASGSHFVLLEFPELVAGAIESFICRT